MMRCLTLYVARRCYRESSILSRSPQALAVLRRRPLVSRRARVRSLGAWLGQQGHLTQSAFSRRDAPPCGRAEPMSVHLTFTQLWFLTPLSFAWAKPIVVKMGIASTHYPVSP